MYVYWALNNKCTPCTFFPVLRKYRAINKTPFMGSICCMFVSKTNFILETGLFVCMYLCISVTFMRQRHHQKKRWRSSKLICKCIRCKHSHSPDIFAIFNSNSFCRGVGILMEKRTSNSSQACIRVKYESNACYYVKQNGEQLPTFLARCTLYICWKMR